MKSLLLSFLTQVMRLLPISARKTLIICSQQTRLYNTHEMERFTLSTKEFPKYQKILTPTPLLRTPGAAHTTLWTLISKSTATSRICKTAQLNGHFAITTIMMLDTQEIVARVVLFQTRGFLCLAEITVPLALTTDQVFNYLEVWIIVSRN